MDGDLISPGIKYKKSLKEKINELDQEQRKKLAKLIDFL